MSFAEEVEISESADAESRDEISDADDGDDPGCVSLGDAEALRVRREDVEYVREAAVSDVQRHRVEIQQRIAQHVPVEDRYLSRAQIFTV